MAGTYNIEADQGSTLTRTITWKQSNGVPVDLSGFTARMHVRTAVDAASVTLEASTSNGRIVLGGVAGTVTINVESSAMEAIAAGSYVYDLELVSPTATPVVTRLVEGTFTVDAEVTR